jgi:uncharacterized membrane protein YeaQ/YmgE (transglycosylase-associated protein family)
MELFLIVLFGSIVGLTATRIMQADIQQGLVLNVGLGILGAIIGGLPMNTLAHTSAAAFNPYTLFAAVIGAGLLIIMIKEFQRA